MPGLSVAAIGRGCAVGVDLMQADPRTPAMQGWRLVARDYLGQSVSLLLDNMPPTQRTVAFTEAWTRLESCLKCNGLPLTEWSSDLAHKSLNCHVVALDLPANCRGSIAVRKKKMAD
jgi:phosphopantetheinyl transferase